MNVIPMKAPLFPDNEQNMNAVPLKAPMFPNIELNQNSSLEELAAYALTKQDGIFARDKTNAQDLWLMGQALTWAKAKVKPAGWEKWWKGKGFKKTYVWQARKLHEHASSLDDVKGLGVTEALVKFGVIAEKKGRTSVQSAKKEPGPTEPNGQGNEPETNHPAKQMANAGEPATDEQPADPLIEQEEKELKEFQETLRQHTPKTRAVAIQHALELLRDELDADDVDEALQQTIGKIAELADELKGLKKPTGTAEAA